MKKQTKNGKKTSGLVLGKFMPLHKGHEMLLHFAHNFVDTLYVVVDHLPDELIPGDRRCQWIKRTIPEAQIFYLPQTNPQDPSEHPNFWNIWKNSLLSLLPEPPDYLFASEQYGFKLAEVLNARYIPFDLERKKIPINATRIRKNPYKYWHYLSSAAQSDFLMRICVFGPESTGKTSLAKELAAHFQTIWVPEYARLLIETKGTLNKQDMGDIARGQLALEEAMAPAAHRFLFCDTDPLATTIWSKWLFKSCPAEITRLAKNKCYDLYLLTDIDLPWKLDQARYFPNRRKEFMSSCIEALHAYRRPYKIVSGKGNKRLKNAIIAVSEAATTFFDLGKWR